MKNVIGYLVSVWTLGIVLMFFCGNQVAAKTVKAPYSVYGQMVLNENGAEKGFEYSFVNNSGKKVIQYELVLSLYDSDGEPVFENDSLRILETAEVEKNGTTEGFLDISDKIEASMNDVYPVDYFYVSRIVYEDGTLCEDPFGIFGMN